MKYLYLALLLITWLSLCETIHGQVSIVTLTGNRQVGGVLTKEVAGEYIDLALFTGDTIRIAHEDVLDYRTRQKAKPAHFFGSNLLGYRKRGRLYAELSFGLTVRHGLYNYYRTATEFQPMIAVSTGIRLNPTQSVSVTAYSAHNEGREFGLYLDYRYKFGRTPSGVVLAARVGTVFHRSYYRGNKDTTLAFYPSIGYYHRGRFRTDWMVDAGLRMYRMQEQQSYDGTIPSRYIRQLTLRYALQF